MGKLAVTLLIIFSLQACSDNKQFELKKFYKDPYSPAAQLLGSTYAGVIETFNSLNACMQMKEDVENEDRKIGYTNSRFVCDEKTRRS